MPATLTRFDCRRMDRLHPDAAKGSRCPLFFAMAFVHEPLLAKKIWRFCAWRYPLWPTRTRVSLYKRAPPGRQAGLYTLSLTFCRKDRTLKIPRVRKAEWDALSIDRLAAELVERLAGRRAADAGCFADAGSPRMKNLCCIFMRFCNKNTHMCELHAGAIWRKGHIRAITAAGRKNHRRPFSEAEIVLSVLFANRPRAAISKIF